MVVFLYVFFGQGSTFIALPRSYVKCVASNISFIQLSSLLSGYPASSFCFEIVEGCRQGRMTWQ